MKTEPDHIAIVGGGTAGWLAALVLKRAFSQSGLGQAPKISLVESPNIPSVGVGEGSTSIFRQVLLDLDIEEEEFLRETGATLKFGIRHEGWTPTGEGYWGPIDNPHLLVPPAEGAPSNWLHTIRIAAGKDVESIHLFTWLMRQGKSAYAEKGDGGLIPLSPFHHAYHFDQSRLGGFLRTKAKGISRIEADVSGVQRDSDTGDVTALHLENAPDLAVDFVVDCTGFRRAIMSRLDSRWVSYLDDLPLDTAMPFWLDHEETAEIPPYTLAKALSAGWMWAIPTSERMGCGYVFSSQHVSADEAQREVEQYLGREIAPRGRIPINPGRLEQAWQHNCVALGLSQSFLEPLEATSIHGTLVQLLLLIRNGAGGLTGQTADVNRSWYNAAIARQVDDFAQFINLHYAGGRMDSEFWQFMTQSGLSDKVMQRLDLWRSEPISRPQFSSFPDGLPHVEEQLHTPVLSGLGLLPRGPSRALMAKKPAIRTKGRKTNDELIEEFRTASQKAIGHKEYLTRVGAI